MDDSRTGKVLQGRYKILGPLAEGGMGVVYRAERIGIGRPVVVKFLHAVLTDRPGVVDRFEREARATARLNHPNCVALVDYGIEDEAPFLVMEYVEGQTLADLLDHGALPPARAVRIVMQVLAGLSHAHERGILHRDLKPANVMIIDAVGWADMVKILDFGLAKLLGAQLGEAAGKREVTVEGIAIGTPGYMSPEQAAGVPSDRRSDVYCAGALLYHLVTGTKAFAGSDVHEVLRRHREETPAAPSVLTPGANISSELEEAIRRAMQREPPRRYQSADDMADALRATPEARAAPTVPASLPGVRTRPEPDSRTRAETPPRRGRAQPRGGGGRGALFVLGLVAGAGAIVAAARYTPFGPRIVALETGTIENGPINTKKDDPVNVKSETATVNDIKNNNPIDAGLNNETKESRAIGAWANDGGAFPVIAPRPIAAEPAPELDDEALAKIDDGAGEDDRSPPPEVDAAPRRDVPQVRRLADVRALIRKGDADGALAGLYRLRRMKPPPSHERAAEIAALIGHLYFDRRFWTDALREYRFAVTVSPRSRSNSILVGNAIRALGDRGTFARARRLVASYLGRSALPALRKAARAPASSAALRRRALQLIASLDSHRR